MTKIKKINQRFRGFLPVVVDIETSGVIPEKNALLEICAVFINLNADGTFSKGEQVFEHIIPFEGAILDKKSLEFNKIDPFQPLRFAVSEKEALTNIFCLINQELNKQKCNHAVLVGHNAWFDLLFLKAATLRTKIKSPFHSFTCFDTATLSALAYKQTVLSKALYEADIIFDTNEAHSAIYDANKTAELFCAILNTWDNMSSLGDR
jgi:ribonuclease T